MMRRPNRSIGIYQSFKDDRLRCAAVISRDIRIVLLAAISCISVSPSQLAAERQGGLRKSPESVATTPDESSHEQLMSPHHCGSKRLRAADRNPVPPDLLLPCRRDACAAITPVADIPGLKRRS